MNLPKKTEVKEDCCKLSELLEMVEEYIADLEVRQDKLDFNPTSEYSSKKFAELYIPALLAYERLVEAALFGTKPVSIH